MLTTTDLRISKTAKIKKVILLYCCTLTYDDVQWYSNITFFIFAVFDVRRSVVVNMCINCSFFYINWCICCSGAGCEEMSPWRHSVEGSTQCKYGWLPMSAGQPPRSLQSRRSSVSDLRYVEQELQQHRSLDVCFLITVDSANRILDSLDIRIVFSYVFKHNFAKCISTLKLIVISRCLAYPPVNHRWPSFSVCCFLTVEHSATERYVSAVTGCFSETPEDSSLQLFLPQSSVVAVQWISYTVIVVFTYLLEYHLV